MLVKDAFLILRRAVDPNAATTGVEITAATLAGTNGEKFTVAQLLDTYNLARRTLVNAIKTLEGRKTDRLKGFLLPEVDLSWQNFSTYSTATIPVGYITLQDDETSLRMGSVPLRLREDPGKLLAGNNPEVTQDATTIYAYERASDFIHYANPSGSSLIPTGTYKVDYIGLVDQTTTEIGVASTTQEGFIEDDVQILISTAIILARNESNATLAQKLADEAIKK